MKGIKFLLILFAVFIFVSCTSDSPIVLKKDNDAPAVSEEKGTAFKEFHFSRADEIIIEKATLFNNNIFSQLIDVSSENVFYSPLGLHSFLSMIVNGTSIDASQEILSALGYENVEDINDYYQRLIPALVEADDQVSYSSLNSVWVDTYLDVKENFINKLYKVYGAEFFKEKLNTESTRLKINDWASDKTEGMIKDFFNESLGENVKMILLNALYFNGRWHIPFEKSETEEEIFHGTTSETKVEMMHNTQYAKYTETEHGICVSLQYGNGTYYLNIFLPNEGEDVESFISMVDKLKPIYGDRKCNISIPKFEITYDNGKLKNVLHNIGIKKIFNDENSLSGIAPSLVVDEIIQKAIFSIDESGAAAAAVTGNTSVTMGDIPNYTSEPDVKVNRPFIFTITAYDDIVLFSGLVRNI